MTFERWDVVRVPFPFTDRVAFKARPAVVLSAGRYFNHPVGHVVLAMVTSAGHTAWPLDCPISNLAVAGLPKPSVLRFKLFTLDASLVARVVGKLAPADRKGAEGALRQVLGIR